MELNRGDIVLIDFNPAKGGEKRREKSLKDWCLCLWN